jgi:hypothetical protein
LEEKVGKEKLEEKVKILYCRKIRFRHSAITRYNN